MQLIDERKKAKVFKDRNSQKNYKCTYIPLSALRYEFHLGNEISFNEKLQETLNINKNTTSLKWVIVFEI